MLHQRSAHDYASKHDPPPCRRVRVARRVDDVPRQIVLCTEAAGHALLPARKRLRQQTGGFGRHGKSEPDRQHPLQHARDFNG
jgi:hypothetical protein